MTRKEQIEHQASEYANDSNNIIEWGDGWEDYNDFDKVFDAFKNGAKWADAKPKFSKEEFIEKAEEWLWNNFYEDPHERWLICSESFDTIEYMIERFKAAMEE